MSTLSMSPFPAASHGVSGAAATSSRGKGLFTALVREIRIRKAMREVGALDDAALHDMGFTPGGIEDAVRHGRR